MLKTVNFTEYINKPSVVKDGIGGRTKGTNGNNQLVLHPSPFLLDAHFQLSFRLCLVGQQKPCRSNFAAIPLQPFKRKAQFGYDDFCQTDLISDFTCQGPWNGGRPLKDVASKPKEIMRVSADSVNRLKKPSKHI